MVRNCVYNKVCLSYCTVLTASSDGLYAVSLVSTSVPLCMSVINNADNTMMI